MSSLKSLQDRGIVEFASSQEIDLDNQSYTFYAGYDPTAKSLHVGHLFVLITMTRLQRLGHKPIAVVGGATGMIGDPSGKSKERVLLTEEVIEDNIRGIQTQIEKFIDVEQGGRVVNNMDWFRDFRFIDFLRDVGKIFRVTEMMSKESVQKRLESDEGISFTEFSYQILQSYDFLHLHREYGCNMQIGGSDQWGNISAGITLIRKEEGSPSFGLTLPLIKSSSGEKFGKTEGQAVWLDPEMTSPYNFYQFWIQTPDADVIQYLRYFTFLPEEEIDSLKASMESDPGQREAQKKLAYEVTSFLHGQEEAEKAVSASQVLFGGSMEGLSDSLLLEIFSDVPSLKLPKSRLKEEPELLDLLIESKMAPSKKQARNLIRQGGVYLNNERVEEESQKVGEGSLVGSNLLVMRTGRKKYCLVRFEEQS